MKELKELTDDELRLHLLYENRDKLRTAKSNARINQYSAEMTIKDLNLVINNATKYIMELERKGVKRSDIKEAENVTPAPIDK